MARRALAVLAMASAGWLGGVAMAQPGATPPRPPATAPAPPPAQPQAQPAAGTADRRVEIKRKIRAFRAYRITEELALDEAMAARVFPLLGKYDQQIEQLTLESVELLKALRPTTIDAKLADDLIRRTLINRRAFLELEEKRIGELRKVLTAGQTARLLVVLPQIERQIKAQIRRSMRRDGEPLNGREDRKRNRKARQRLELDDVE